MFRVIREVPRAQRGSQRVRRHRRRVAIGAARSEHPVGRHAIAFGRCIDCGLDRAVPRLTRKRTGDARRGPQQSSRVGSGGQRRERLVGVFVSDRIENPLVNRVVRVLDADYREQRLASAANELVTRCETPIGMRAQVPRVERQQPLGQVEFFARRQSCTTAPVSDELRRQERGIGTRRLGQHEVRLECGVTVACETAELIVKLGGGHLGQIDQLSFDVLLHRGDEPRTRFARVVCPQGGKRVLIMIQAEAREERRMLCARLVKLDTLLEREQGSQTRRRIDDTLESTERIVREREFARVGQAGGQQACAPQADGRQRNHR